MDHDGGADMTHIHSPGPPDECPRCGQTQAICVDDSNIWYCGKCGYHGEIYVLITQCLQNDFFLNLNCRLVLPKDAAGKLLIHSESEQGFNENGSNRTIDAETIQCGPLGRLLMATVGKRQHEDGRMALYHGTLHLVNIRDWHIAGDSYDQERRIYGAHCEAGTYGAEYVNSL